MAETILTPGDSSSSSPLNPASSRIICHVCHKQFSQYTCPRCNSRYCSLHCYKSHSLRCTESFMRENVMEELQQVQPNDETRHKMLSILKRFHSEEETEDLDEDEDENYSTLSEETMQKVLSGDQLILDDLSTEEKKQFLRAIATGELSKMIEPWEPWWSKPSAKSISLSKEGTQLIQLIPEHETSTSQQNPLDSIPSSEIPLGPESPLPPISKLTSTKPSPLLAIHLVDILYSYCFTLRLYNGDWKSDPLGSAMVVLSISSVLGQNGQPETLSEALSFSLEQICSPAYRHMGGLKLGLGLIDDVISLLSLGGPAMVCLLCDLQRLVQAARRVLKSEKLRKLKKVEIGNKLKVAERKIYFMMCFVHEQKGEALSSLADILRVEKSSFLEFEGLKSSAKMDKNEESSRRVLIQEMK